jgi:hypothetical protein
MGGGRCVASGLVSGTGAALVVRSVCVGDVGKLRLVGEMRSVRDVSVIVGKNGGLRS